MKRHTLVIVGQLLIHRASELFVSKYEDEFLAATTTVDCDLLLSKAAIN